MFAEYNELNDLLAASKFLAACVLANELARSALANKETARRALNRHIHDGGYRWPECPTRTDETDIVWGAKVQAWQVECNSRLVRESVLEGRFASASADYDRLKELASRLNHLVIDRDRSPLEFAKNI